MSDKNIDCQQAAEYLGVSVKTIRRWAQTGIINGKKVGSRGDWRFTHEELNKMVAHSEHKYEAIARFFHDSAAEIQQLASKMHDQFLGKKGMRGEKMRLVHPYHVKIIDLLAEHLDDVERGRVAFEKLSSEIAKASLDNGLTIEETIDGVMFIKEAIWVALEGTDLLQKLTTRDFYALSRTLSTYSHVIASQLAFAYHHQYEQSQDAMRRSGEMFSKVFHSSPVPMTLVDIATGKFVDVNEHYLKMTGYIKSEMVGHSAIELALFASKPTVKSRNEWYKMLEKSGKVRNYTVPIHAKDGTELMVNGSAIIVPINGKSHLITQHIDVTEKLKTEENNYYQVALANSLADAIISLDKDNQVVSWNEGAEKLYDLTANEVMGKTPQEFLTTTIMDGAADMADVYNRLDQKGKWRGEIFQRTTKGKEITALSSIAAIRDKEGNNLGRVVVNHDISNRKLADKALREREERYRTLFNSIDDGFCIVEVLYDKKGKACDGRYIETNEQFEKVSGMKNALGRTLKEIVPSADEKWIEQYAKVAETGEPLRYIEHADWHDQWFEMYLTRVGGPDSRLVAILFQDVTEKLKLQQERETAMNKVINTLESISEAFVQLDKHWNVVLLNEAFAKLARRPKDELLGRNIWKISDEGKRMEKLFKEKLEKVISSGEPSIFENYNEEFDTWFELRAYLVDEGIAVFLRNITEHKKADEERAHFNQLSAEHDELIKLTKAKDEFIGIASHQLRTPATAVKQYMGILLAGFGGELTSEQKQYIQTAYDSNERQLKLINDLLKTAQIDAEAYTLHRSPQKIDRIVQMAVDAHKTTFDRRRQKIEFIDLSNRAQADVDPIEMDLVFSNLIDNASKYSPHSTTVKITIQQNDRWVEVSVADQGVGISPADKDKIFDKFTRIGNELSDIVSGTGLGLYWVKHIVDMHGGSIEVASEPKKGSTFTVRLPK